MQAERDHNRIIMCVGAAAVLWLASPTLADEAAALVGPRLPDLGLQTTEAAQSASRMAIDEPAAETTAPESDADAAATVPAELPAQEQLALGRDRSTRTTLGTDRQDGERPSIMDHWAVRTVGALAIVIGLALVLRMLARSVAGHAGGIRGQLGAGGRAPSGVMSILARFPIARGQTLVLLQLDRRVLLLNQTPVGFATLTELVDAEEVASIIRKCDVGTRSGRDDSNGFDSVMRAMERDPEVATGRLDGGGYARNAVANGTATKRVTKSESDPISRAQALLQATRRAGTSTSAVRGGAT